MLSAHRAAARIARRAAVARTRTLCSAPQLRLHPALEKAVLLFSRKAVWTAADRSCMLCSFRGCSGCMDKERPAHEH